MLESKQVKVDNWGIFFLQRLQQFYNKSSLCDLTLQFEDNVQIKVHKLVMNACTEYFQMLEQTCEMVHNCLMMPSNLPSDVVIPIINFMYSGILEFHESLFDRLYSTAKLMNMSVLTKLLDAQKTPIRHIPQYAETHRAQKRIQSVTPITWNLQGRRISTRIDSDLPETLPGRKLPIWKRKSIPSSLPFLSANNYESYTPKMIKTEEPPKPTRFDWPEEDASFENSFDDISYESKPLILPTYTPEKQPKPSTSSTFEEMKKTAVPVKRAASPLGNQCKKVNIQDVKEYLKEHKIRSDYIDYDDSEMADNDLQTFENDDSNEEHSKDATDVTNTDETPNKSILKNDTGSTPTQKHVRFSLTEGNDNTDKKIQTSALKSGKPMVVTPKGDQNAADMPKHTKIITEVLKKYPHLVKKNKNIRLKILVKGNNPPNTKSGIVKTSAANVKQTSKVSYVVVKPEKEDEKSNDEKQHSDTVKKDIQTWECTQCEEPQTFASYHTYRLHLEEAHEAKQDSQMCTLCGYISKKRNMLVYHKFIKHNEPPPAMYNFPKCKDCPYIAFSPTILQKHMASHTATNFSCHECQATFPNKTTLISHLQQMGHSQDRLTPQWGCNYCDKRFFSEKILSMHMKCNHEDSLKLTQSEESKLSSENEVKVKDKIKILSDVKVSASIPNQMFQVKGMVEKTDPQTSEQSSEAEALSNVASGIAASLGLVDTIVVLDENQFILQPAQANIQQNILNSSGTEYILPDMQMQEITHQNINHPTVTLSSDTTLTQSLHKEHGITSTDELVMVLTDHDYSDGTNNAVITDNSIVVLYSHPVQTQAGTMMLTSEAGMIQVDKNYAHNIPVTLAEQTSHCEESIEMIQQEINNQLDSNTIQGEETNMEQATEGTYIVESKHEEPEMENITQIENKDLQSIDNNSVIVYQSTDGELKEIPQESQIKQGESTYVVTNTEEDTQLKEPEPTFHDTTLAADAMREQHMKDLEYGDAEIKHLQNDSDETKQERVQYEDVEIKKIQFENPSVQEEMEYEEAEIKIINQGEEVPVESNTFDSAELKQIDEQVNQETNYESEIKSFDNEENTQEMPANEENNYNSVEVDQEISSNETINLENDPQMENNEENLNEEQKVEHTMENDDTITNSLSIDIENTDISKENVENTPEVEQNLENVPREEIVDENISTEVLSIQTPQDEDVAQEETENEKITTEDTLEVQNTPCNKIESENNTDLTQENSVLTIQDHLVSDEINVTQQDSNLQVTPAITKDIMQMESEIAEDASKSIVDEELSVEVDVKENITSESIVYKTDENPEVSIETNSDVEQSVNLENQGEISTEVDECFVQNETVKNTTEVETSTQINSKLSENQNVQQKSENTTTESNDGPTVLKNEKIINKIINILEDWDDGDTDSQQSYTKVQATQETENRNSSIDKLIDDWDEEEDS